MDEPMRTKWEGSFMENSQQKPQVYFNLSDPLVKIEGSASFVRV
jgi:hypothetical protein